MDDPNQLPALPSLSEWLGNLLGFQIPSLPLPQTLKNLDKAFARLVLAGGENIASRWEGDTAHRDARSRADVQVMDSTARYSAEKLPVDAAFAERAASFTFSESLLKQRNREKIFEHAAHELSNKAPAADRDIEDDWLNEFSDIAAKKSSADIQLLWGKILAGEIRTPGSFSLQFLKTLSHIDSAQANQIHDFMKFAVFDGFMHSGHFENVDQALAMEELGVIIGIGTLNRSVKVIGGIVRYMHLSGIVLGISAEKGISIDVPVMNLTSFGRALLTLTEPPPAPDDYVKAFVSILKDGGAKVQRATALTRLPDEEGNVQISEWQDM